MGWRRPIGRSTILLLLAPLAGAAPAASRTARGSAIEAAAGPLAAHEEPIIGHLALPGQRLRIAYTVDTPGATSATGWLYVRNDGMRRFERIALRRAGGAGLAAVVPGRLLAGGRLRYYARIVDPRSRRSVTVPAQGARRPDFVFVLERPVLVQLGVHRFGRTRPPDEVVARAAPDEVGWQLEGDPFGPQTFLVGSDGAVWLVDGLNGRLLRWRPGEPDRPAATVPLPFLSADSDVALGPSGSFYLLRGLPAPHPRTVLERVSAAGEVWQSDLAGTISTRTGDVAINTALRSGPDGRLYLVASRPGSAGGERGWTPVATREGEPIPVAAQRRGDRWPFQPVAGSLRLLAQVDAPRPDAAPREVRLALVDRADRVVRSWRILSGTDVNFAYATPELVGGDPVIVLDITAAGERSFRWEELVLRLGSHGAVARFSLPRAVFGDNLLADLRVGPGASIFALASSPTAGIEIRRYSLAG